MDLPNSCSTIPEYTDEQLAQIELFKDYPKELRLFAVVCCGFYMLFGIPGNLITIIALARCKKIQNATTVFILNLACSDMLFCCFNLPLISATYWRQHWPYGKIVCRMFPMAGYGLTAVSLLTILAIMVNRYILIAYPRLYPMIFKAQYIAAIVASTWLLPFGVLMPTWFEKWGRFGMNSAIGSCSILLDCNGRSPKKFLIGFVLIPCLLVLICYLRIFCIAQKSAKRSLSTKRQKKPHQKRVVPAMAPISTNSVPGQKPMGSEIEGHLGAASNICHPSVIDPELSSYTSISFDDIDENHPSTEKNEVKGKNDVQKRFRQSLAVLKQVRRRIKTYRPSTKDRSLLRIIMTLIVSFWVCYLPIMVIKVFCDFSPVPRVLGNLLVYLPSCINPIIYVLMSREYRQAYKSLFTCTDLPDTSRVVDSKNSKSQRMSEVRIHAVQRGYALTAV